MFNQDIFYLIGWILASSSVSFYFHKKVSFFQKPKGVFALFGLFLALITLRKGVFVLFKIEESVLLPISIFCFGALSWLIIFQLIKKILPGKK